MRYTCTLPHCCCVSVASCSVLYVRNFNVLQNSTGWFYFSGWFTSCTTNVRQYSQSSLSIGRLGFQSVVTAGFCRSRGGISPCVMAAGRVGQVRDV